MARRGQRSPFPERFGDAAERWCVAIRRILVIGPCGAGKSTLSIELGRKLAIPVYHLDQLHWHPGSVETSTEELIEKVEKITSTESWLIDGNYGGTMAGRLARADTVIYLEYPIRLCLWRALRRIWTYRGRTRPDMTEGCPERFDLEFIIYILTWNNGPGPRTESALQNFGGTIVRFQSPRALEDWLAALPADLAAPLN